MMLKKQYRNIDITPTKMLEKSFDDSVIDMLVENTEKYAMHKSKHSFTTKTSEIRLFIAILMTSGYAPLTRRRLYWDPSEDVHNSAISQLMTRNRFEELMSVIHVAGNNT